MLTTGEIYAQYDALITRTESWVTSRNPRLAGYHDAQVRSRIVQRIVEVTNEGFTPFAIERASLSGQDPFRDPGDLSLGGIKISTDTGKIEISASLALKNLFLFALSWTHILAYLTIAVFRRCPRASGAATLLMEGGGYEQDDVRFVRFCRQGRILPLVSASRIIVKTKSPPANPTDSKISYTEHPVIFLVSNYLCRRDRIAILARHLLAPFAYLRALAASPLNLLLSRDLAVAPVVSKLDEKKLVEAVVITTSAFATQFIWMKGIEKQNFQLHMIWYSQNFIPKIYRGEEKGSNLPAARFMRVDVHWVWTSGFEGYLRELGQDSSINVIGPILWYLPEGKPIFTDQGLKIAVFDVTPVIAGKAIFGAAKNYYTVETITRFVSDVVEICSRLSAETGSDIKILLKHKKMPRTGLNDSSYIDFLDDLVRNNENFELIDHRTNIYDLLAACELSISVPYTSTAYVGAHVNKPGIYYDPFAELIPKYESNEFVSFASGPDELRRLLTALISTEQQDLRSGSDGYVAG